jgi:hypothetical protein
MGGVRAQSYSPHFVHFVSFFAVKVLRFVALPTQTLKVIPVQSHRRIVYVLRSDVDFVMHDAIWFEDSLLQTFLAQPPTVTGICITALLPRLGAVKLSRIWFHVNKSEATIEDGLMQKGDCMNYYSNSRYDINIVFLRSLLE